MSNVFTFVPKSGTDWQTMLSFSVCSIHLKNLKMKTTFRLLAFSTLIFSLILTSCGPSKKLLLSQARVDKLQKDSTNTHLRLNECTVQVNKRSNEKSSLLDENAAVQNDLKSLSAESKMTIADQAKRLKSLQDMIQAQKLVL